MPATSAGSGRAGDLPEAPVVITQGAQLPLATTMPGPSSNDRKTRWTLDRWVSG